MHATRQIGWHLEVTLGERKFGGDEDLALLTLDGDLVSEVSGLAVHLDALLEEGLEVGTSVDQKAILEWDSVVDRELGEFGGGSFLWSLRKRESAEDHREDGSMIIAMGDQ